MMRTIVKARRRDRGGMSPKVVSPRVRNLIIGMSRAYDPNPIVEKPSAASTKRESLFQDAFAIDMKNLLKDRSRGERRIFGGKICVSA